MKIVPLDQLEQALEASETIAVVYPFDSPRSFGAGDPAALARRDANDLFLLTLQRFSARFGEPDVPSTGFETGHEFSEASELRAVWDFDYYALVLSVAALGDDRFGVQLTRREPR